MQFVEMRINPITATNPLESTDSTPHQHLSPVAIATVTPGSTPSRHESGMRLLHFNLVLMNVLIQLLEMHICHLYQ